MSKAYFNDFSHDLEMRARIVMEGFMGKSEYVIDECLDHSAVYTHKNADLPTVYVTYSEYYQPGQKITDDTINYVRSREIHSCAHVGHYMGLWQLAQASSVLGIPIPTVYPFRGDSTIRNDFNRLFFPLVCSAEPDDEPIRIMWTAIKKGCAPIHFVPLLSFQ